MLRITRRIGNPGRRQTVYFCGGMRRRRQMTMLELRITLISAITLLAVGCGNEIGDSCSISTDCSTSGDRICDRSQPGGYCTVPGCDHDTCPENSVCIRFFTSVMNNVTCDAATEDVSTNDCAPEELCTLSGLCAPRSAEVRFCMKTCESNGDCRDEYECRDEELMRQHGGEPVPPPGDNASVLQRFCAPAPLVL